MTDKGKILIIKLEDLLFSLLMRENRIHSIQVQRPDNHAVGNIYIGKVQNISENIGAAFVNLGERYLAFLPLAETRHAIVTNRVYDGKLKAEDEIVVQIVKEPMKTKQAGVTANLTLSGNYVVVKDTGGKGASIQSSSKLNRRQKMRFSGIEGLQEIGKHCQVIVRTNAGTLTEDALLVEEAAALSKRLDHIKQIADKRTCYSCLHTAKPDYLHFIQNTYTTEYDEIVTDLPEVYEVLLENLPKTPLPVPVRLYEDAMLPLHKLYAVESRLKELLDKKVWLRSGGYLVIEPTEALISIDVNSGKYERGSDWRETAIKINLEAAEMIALQLRARNLSGIILVDFINMEEKEQAGKLMDYMRSLLRKDSIHADVVDMTGLGLMEITRKKVRPSLAEQIKQSHGKKGCDHLWNF